VIALSASVTLPESAGTLKLASRDPGAAPLIDCNFLATGRDARRMLGRPSAAAGRVNADHRSSEAPPLTAEVYGSACSAVLRGSGWDRSDG